MFIIKQKKRFCILCDMILNKMKHIRNKYYMKWNTQVRKKHTSISMYSKSSLAKSTVTVLLTVQQAFYSPFNMSTKAIMKYIQMHRNYFQAIQYIYYIFYHKLHVARCIVCSMYCTMQRKSKTVENKGCFQTEWKWVQ